MRIEEDGRFGDSHSSRQPRPPHTYAGCLNQALLKHPSADQLDRHYLDLGSEGLRHFAKMRHVCARMIAAAIEHHPETFADARRCTTPCRPWSDA
jgi:hypothetical protein